MLKLKQCIIITIIRRMKAIISMTSFKNTFLLLFCLLLVGCKKNTLSELLEFNVNGNYPVMTLDIEDVANIEYLILEVDDDYLFSHFITMTDNFLICGASDEFLFFNRTTGKPVSKVSRRGNGPGDYNLGIVPVYSEKQDEFFLFDLPAGIKVYGKDGTFKRKFALKANIYPSGLNSLYDYDDERLLFNCFSFSGDMKDTSFFLISKQDGFMKEIHIPYDEKVDLILTQGIAGAVANGYFAVRNGKDYLLTEYSSDTVYRFTSECELIPVLVRTPSIQKMETKILLHSWLETDNYKFFSTEKLEIDWNNHQGFQTKGYLMEKHTGKFFQTNMRMRDYKEKELIIGPSVIDKTPNQHTGIIVLTALELHKANEENKLEGKLKEVTERLTEDDEYIFMILTFK